DGVGVAFNSGGDRRVGTHELGQALDVLTELGATVDAVEVELDIQLSAYGLHFRSRFRCRTDSRNPMSLTYYLSGLAAAEVQTQTNAGLPFGVAVVQTMHHVHTGLDEEVLVQIVLHTNTGQSHGGTVTLAGEGLVQLLMTEATGNVGTDSTLSEMV